MLCKLLDPATVSRIYRTPTNVVKPPTGQLYGHWEVLGVRMTDRSPAGKARTRWLCLCTLCGKTEKWVLPGNLRSGSNNSCGCHRRTHGGLASKARTVDGKTPAPYYLWLRAKERAAKLGREFTIEVADIKIPDTCPLLGIAIQAGTGVKGAQGSCSPSLDRIDSGRGYTPDNVWTISLKANRMKSDATFAELATMVNNAKLLGLL